MEVVIFNSLNIGDKVIVVFNGYFGERFVDICCIQGVEVVEICMLWGIVVFMEFIQEMYELYQDVKVILVVYSEIFIGVKNDI